MRRFLSAMGVALALLGGAEARAQNKRESQQWLGAFVTGRLTGQSAREPGLSLWTDLHGRWAPDRTVVLVRPGLGYRLNALASLWAGYGWIPTIPDEGETTYEHRIWQQGLVQGAWGPVNFQVRPRLEQRFRDGHTQIGHRFRLMGRWNVRFSQDLPLALALWDEVFVGLNRTSWGARDGYDQNRLFVGIAWAQGVWRFEPGYLNVTVKRADGSLLIQHNAALMVFLTF